MLFGLYRFSGMPRGRAALPGDPRQWGVVMAPSVASDLDEAVVAMRDRVAVERGGVGQRARRTAVAAAQGAVEQPPPSRSDDVIDEV